MAKAKVGFGTEHPRPPAENGEWGEDIEGIRESDEDPGTEDGTAEVLSETEEEDEEGLTLTFPLRVIVEFVRLLARG